MNSKLSQLITESRAEDLEDILKTVLKRYAELYPQWELSIISVEKGRNRKQQIDRIISLLEKMKKGPSC